MVQSLLQLRVALDTIHESTRNDTKKLRVISWIAWIGRQCSISKKCGVSGPCDSLDRGHDRGKSRSSLRRFGAAGITPEDFPPTRTFVMKLPLVASKDKRDTLPVVTIKPTIVQRVAKGGRIVRLQLFDFKSSRRVKRELNGSLFGCVSKSSSTRGRRGERGNESRKSARAPRGRSPWKHL